MGAKRRCCERALAPADPFSQRERSLGGAIGPHYRWDDSDNANEAVSLDSLGNTDEVLASRAASVSMTRHCERNLGVESGP